MRGPTKVALRPEEGEDLKEKKGMLGSRVVTVGE
jgi:hypothetical protein